MSRRIKQIDDQIQQLSPTLHALRAWFADYDSAAWDRQFESDINAGKLEPSCNSS